MVQVQLTPMDDKSAKDTLNHIWREYVGIRIFVENLWSYMDRKQGMRTVTGENGIKAWELLQEKMESSPLMKQKRQNTYESTHGC